MIGILMKKFFFCRENKYQIKLKEEALDYIRRYIKVKLSLYCN